MAGLNLEPMEDWALGGEPAASVEMAMRVTRDLAFLAANQGKAPRLFEEVKSESARAFARAFADLAPQLSPASNDLLKRLEAAWPTGTPGRDAVLLWLREKRTLFWRSFQQKILVENVESSPADVGEAEEEAFLAALEKKFQAAEARVEKQHILDAICSWPTPAALPALVALTQPVWARDRALLNLTLRFGRPALRTWPDWLDWLSAQAGLWQTRKTVWDTLIAQHPYGLLLILYFRLSDPDPAVLDTLVKIVGESAAPIQVRDLIAARVKSISMPEQRALLGLPEPLPPPIPPVIAGFPVSRPGAQPPPIPASQHPTAPAEAEAAPRPVAPVPPRPSIWAKHIQPLFVENWYIVAGIAMVILGSSLLAYYTWDKHWLVRYTIMPVLLGLFTWSLAAAGRWIEKKGAEFKSTAAILRGAAIGLLPINFMAMALLSADEKVPQKGPALLVMALIYLSVFGWSLRSWCAAVEPALKNLLAGTLLLLNALVAVGPLARTVGHLEGQPLLICLGAGFYLGFILMAATIVWFTRRVMTRELAEEKRVPWFVAASLAITYLQVFVWVHGFMRHVPQAATYALLVILTGWLILFSERRALELKGSPQLHGGESFLGFALILLGLLMGFNQPAVRIAAFLTAGVVWMYQAFSRRHPLHHWIALTLLGLGVASVGLLARFPGPWLPSLGVLLAVGFGLGGWLSRRAGQRDLGQACLGMEVVALVITALVAPLAQWHFASAPLATAGWLLVVALLFAWRALK
ncbi:MAG TPA: hypothetical protein VN794_08765, partial [Methylomirabilota bacterium]|nr:hypothetical protein [Methylomirabilota bacterium]